MYILLVLLISLLIALARGGQFTALGKLQFRYLGLFFVPLAIQLAIFTPLRSLIGGGEAVDRIAYLASMGIAAVALVLNRHIPGAAWIAIGMSLNLLVIAINGGVMPIWPEARQLAGMPPLTGRSNNGAPFTSETRLPWLADVIPLPSFMPLANVFSIGDLLIMCGVIILTQRVLMPQPAQEQ